MLPDVVLGIKPSGTIVACDFYVEGVELGEEVPGGYRLGRLLNVDHHAPTPRMSRIISSTNLAVAQVAAEPVDGRAAVVLNHTDCDSVLSGAIMAGLIFPEQHYGAAAIAADHTGEENRIADLLQALEPFRDPWLSLRNLDALERGKRLDDLVPEQLEERGRHRRRAERYVMDGHFQSTGGLAWAILDRVVDATFFPALLPNACLILLAMPMPERSNRWEAKLRLGLAAPPGMTLHDLGISDFDPAFGGRWNAGSNRRAGGTSLPVESYAAMLCQRIWSHFQIDAARPTV